MSKARITFSLIIALLLFVVGVNLTMFTLGEAEQNFAQFLSLDHFPREIFWSVFGVISFFGSILILESVVYAGSSVFSPSIQVLAP